MTTENTFSKHFTFQLRDAKQPEHLSTLIADAKITLNLPKIMDARRRLLRIDQYNAFVYGLLQLGEMEHTGDWDPYFSIILHDGTKLDTSDGYPDLLAYKDDPEELKYHRIIRLPSLEAYEFGLITAERLEESEDLDDVDASEEEIAEAKQKFTNLGIKALDDDYGSPGAIMVAIPISTIKSITLEY